MLDELGLGRREQARRNVVTRGIRLNPLVGARFTVGGVECAGRRLCEPCAHLERLGGPGMLRAWCTAAACAPTCSPTARSPSAPRSAPDR